MEPLYLVTAAVVAVVLALWLSWTANRLDRMHHRIDVARASLDAQLLHRSGTTLELATAGVLDPARSLVLADAAHAARAAPSEGTESAQSDLSQALRIAFADATEVGELGHDPDSGQLVHELAGDCRKVVLARRFHNDVVAAARVLRSRRRVRWLRLAGHAADLHTVDFDDEAPFGFTAREP